jgi:hypothetical protein
MNCCRGIRSLCGDNTNMNPLLVVRDEIVETHAIFLIQDIVIRILEFATSEELNTYAGISATFRLASADDRLTRTVTVTLDSHLEDYPVAYWIALDARITGNFQRLVVNVTRLTNLDLGQLFGRFYNRGTTLPDEIQLTNILEVVLQRDPSLQEPSDAFQHGEGLVTFFKKLLPNLTSLDIGALSASIEELPNFWLNNTVCAPFPTSIFRCSLEVFNPGVHFCLTQPSRDTSSLADRNILQEIHIDPLGVILVDGAPMIAYCRQYRSHSDHELSFEHADDAHPEVDWVLLQEYPNLQRVTLKNAKYVEFDDRHVFWMTLPQEALIKFVRHALNLSWFCSDLTQENIAILQLERPDVEFCN